MKVPEGWKWAFVSDFISHFESGVSVNGDDSPAQNNEFGVLKVSAVTEGVFREEENKRIEGGELQRAAVHPKADRILMSRANSPELVGACAYLDQDYPNRFLSDKLWQFEPHKSTTIDMRWLHQLLSSPEYRRQLSSLATGTSMSMKNIPQESVFRLALPTPPLPEQKAIADTLSTWDTAIETMERLITAKEASFRHLRAEAIHQAAVVHKALSPLSQAFQPLTRKNTSGETNVLTTSAQRGLVSQQTYFSKSIASENLEGYFLVERGDFAFNRSSSNGYPYGAIKRLEDSERGVLSTLNICMSLREPGHHNSDFFVHVFEAGYLNRGLSQICQEGARSHGLLNVSREDFFGLELPIPDKSTQDRIADKLNLVQRELVILRKQFALLKLQKRGLMQKLLTGAWRVPVPQEAP